MSKNQVKGGLIKKAKKLVALFMAIFLVGCASKFAEKGIQKESSVDTIFLEADTKKSFVYDLETLQKVEKQPEDGNLGIKNYPSFYVSGVKNYINRSSMCLRGNCFPIKKLPPLELEELTVKYVSFDPIWVASDEYFIERGLPIPEKNSKYRFLKGALESFEIYTEEGYTISASKFTLPDSNLILVDAKGVTFNLEPGEKISVLKN
ncbi:MAG: hypothetical protein N2654_02250 [Deltaproteobacteria bacterium]|nr:hypothetical protein [Deltaproteobacteria bacterium]